MNNKILSIAASLIVVFVATAGVFFSPSKTDIRGTVYNDSTRQKLPDVHVFLAGTTFGAVTDKDGFFTIQNVPHGAYQLVVRHIGYRDSVIQVNTNEQVDDLKISLRENIYELEEFTVTTNNNEWKRQYEIFEENFLGMSQNSESTEIRNPEVLSFNYDSSNDVLTAQAHQSLIINNDALGYQIEYYLEYFAHQMNTTNTAYFGYPVYKEMESRRRWKQRDWNRSREKAYLGSLQHFLKTLIQGNYHEEGFEIKAEIRTSPEQENPQFTKLLEKSSRFTKTELADGQTRYVSKDTLDTSHIFYQKDENTYVLKFVNLLGVKYLKETENYNYRLWKNGDKAVRKPGREKYQESVLTLQTDSLLIHKTGHVYNPTDLIVGGFWGFEKLADSVPADYAPGPD